MGCGPAGSSSRSSMSVSAVISQKLKWAHRERQSSGICAKGAAASSLAKPLDFNPDAAGVGDYIGFFDTHANGGDAPIGKAGGGDAFGERLNQMHMALGDNALDLANDNLVAHDVADIVLQRVRAFTNRQVDVDDDALGFGLFMLVDAERSYNLEVAHENVAQPHLAAGHMVGEPRLVAHLELLLHIHDVGGLPNQMLAAVEGDHLPGHGGRGEDETKRLRYFLRRRSAL